MIFLFSGEIFPSQQTKCHIIAQSRSRTMAPVPHDTSRVSSEKDNEKDANEKDASSFGLGVEELGGGEFVCNQRRSTREWIDDTRLAMRTQMSMKRFHMTIISLVGFDLLVVMAELIVGTPP